MTTNTNAKFRLVCRACQHTITDFKTWFAHNQACPQCGGKWAEVNYHKAIDELKPMLQGEAENLYHYFDFLPINDRKNVVTAGEGVIPVERWTMLEQFAKKHYGLDLEVSVYRNDLNPATHTFKDVAAAAAASVLKENGVTQYVVASTGNIASAFAYYLAKAGINLSVFIPNDALPANEAEASAYGQKVFRVKGDYAKAKTIAAEYARKHGFLMSGGNTDPIRVEAKKTMVFEWLRQTGKVPQVYVQALSGGTGPIAIDKALRDIKPLGLVSHTPRYIMVQPSGCDPMTQGYAKAKKAGFPNGWEKDYPIIDSPKTDVPTLATGNPATYPIIAKLVHESKGDIITFDESKVKDIARLVAFEQGVKIGPASSVALGGFFEALKLGLLHSGETVLVNLGESMNRAPELAEQMRYTTELVSSADDCRPPERNNYRQQLWQEFVPEKILH